MALSIDFLNAFTRQNLLKAQQEKKLGVTFLRKKGSMVFEAQSPGRLALSFLCLSFFVFF